MMNSMKLEKKGSEDSIYMLVVQQRMYTCHAGYKAQFYYPRFKEHTVNIASVREMTASASCNTLMKDCKE